MRQRAGEERSGNATGIGRCWGFGAAKGRGRRGPEVESLGFEGSSDERLEIVGLFGPNRPCFISSPFNIFFPFSLYTPL